MLALVHIATLGWLTMTIMGASLQLVPVIIVGPLRAARLLLWQYPVYVVSVTLLVCGFWLMQSWLLVLGGTGVLLAVAHYVVVLAATLAHAPKRPLTLRFLVASLVYLCLVVSLGLTAALNLQWNFLGTAFDQAEVDDVDAQFRVIDLAQGLRNPCACRFKRGTFHLSSPLFVEQNSVEKA